METNIIQYKNVIPDTHFFIYKNNKYPFKFDFFKYASQYFNRNEEELSKTKNINLFDCETEKKLAVADQTIKDFINFVQSKKIIVTNENVFHLNYLSNIYEVNALSEKTTEYISSHQKDLVLQIIEAHQNDSKFDTKIYEDIILQNIGKYLKDKRLLNIQIPILYRIINKYNNNNKQDKIQKQMNEFLLKILKKVGRSASVLFENYDFGETREEMILTLIREYSNIFDFQYICSEMIKTINFIEEQKNANKISFDQILSSKNSEIDQLQQQNRELKEQTQNLCKSIEIKEKEHSNQISKQKQNSDKIITSQNDKINKMAQQIKDLQIQNEKFSETIKIKEQKINDLIQNNKKNDLLLSSIPLLFNNNEFNGIIKYLTDKTGGNIHENQTINVTSNECYSGPVYLLDFDNSTFQTKRSGDAWICFDFKDKKVKITNYSIRSYYGRPNTHHFKSWKIEVSNDGQKWIQIDEQKNCTALNGSSLTATFSAQPNDFSRYVRLSQTDKTWGGDGYTLAFCYLEFYGYLKI